MSWLSQARSTTLQANHDRLIPDKPPFTAVGVDFFGPFQERPSRSLVKICIFTCLDSQSNPSGCGAVL